MRNSDTIKALAYERLAEAEILCGNGKYDGAFYLAGYSIELMLKAKICERFGVDNLFDETCKTYGVSEVRKAVKTHDLAVLLFFSGLYQKFNVAKSENWVLAQTNIRLFDVTGHNIWSEQIRYQPVGSQQSASVRQLIGLLNHEEGLLQWIDKS